MAVQHLHAASARPMWNHAFATTHMPPVRRRRKLSLEAVLALTAGLLAFVAVGATAAALAITSVRSTAATAAVQPPDATMAPSTTPPVEQPAKAASPQPVATTAPEPVATGPEPSSSTRRPQGQVTDADVAAARASSVAISNDSCDKGGSGWTFAPHYVATNAHVVRGDTGGVDLRASDGRVTKGRVVAIDNTTDVAVVYAPGLATAPLRWSAEDAPVGLAVAWIGYPEGKAAVGPGVIRIHNNANVDGVVVDAYMLTVTGIKGMSGGPMIAPGGVVRGMNVGVADEDSAAIVESGAHIAPTLDAARGRTAAVATGSC